LHFAITAAPGDDAAGVGAGAATGADATGADTIGTPDGGVGFAVTGAAPVAGFETITGGLATEPVTVDF
jgi:hypothetical protein